RDDEGCDARSWPVEQIESLLGGTKAAPGECTLEGLRNARVQGLIARNRPIISRCFNACLEYCVACLTESVALVDREREPQPTAQYPRHVVWIRGDGRVVIGLAPKKRGGSCRRYREMHHDRRKWWRRARQSGQVLRRLQERRLARGSSCGRACDPCSHYCLCRLTN